MLPVFVEWGHDPPQKTEESRNDSFCPEKSLQASNLFQALAEPPPLHGSTQTRGLGIRQTSILQLPGPVTLNRFLSFSEPRFGCLWKETMLPDP